MARYGAKYLQWAPFATSSPDESATALPKYGTPINLGALNQVSDSPTFIEGSIYGDNGRKEYVQEFQELTVDVSVTELEVATAGAVLGATVDDDDGIIFTDSDNAPYGGLGFYVRKMVNNVVFYQGIYYPKLKATMQSETFDTKGSNITLSGDKIKFEGEASANGTWKMKSDNLTTEALAKAWVDALVVAASTT